MTARRRIRRRDDLLGGVLSFLAEVVVVLVLALFALVIAAVVLALV